MNEIEKLNFIKNGYVKYENLLKNSISFSCKYFSNSENFLLINCSGILILVKWFFLSVVIKVLMTSGIPGCNIWELIINHFLNY